MTSLSLKPASELNVTQLADLMTRSFEDYFVPVTVTEDALLERNRRESVDLTSSRIFIDGDEPIGVGLIARRGWTSRLAAMGIIKSARSKGVGTWAMEKLIEDARMRGDKEMLLEVIEQNTVGVKLYQKVGFKTIRRLVGFKLENPQVEDGEDLKELDIRELARLVTYHGLKDLPWQLSGTSIMHHTPPSRAFRLNDAYCLISDPSVDDVVIWSVLVKARSRGAGLSPVLIRSIFAKYPNKTWHVPVIFPEEMSPIFEDVGMERESISQWQMLLKL